ncbi:hypothetical protein [Vibrio sinaloensis]|uniref:Uncharacterized protein n=1 Tax=Photobacterium sp. (strain ATCC 43367) TaxID=379097 RepID=A0A0A5JFN1_PHOS4|nr:hypothetical protein [Vibrio sinaloensis]KGY06813.1 hypothetical protein NM06_20460 [Vibrio sinaloensis]
MNTNDDIFIRVIRYAVDKDKPFDLLGMYDDLGISNEQRHMLTEQIASGVLLAHQTSTQIVHRKVREHSSGVEVWCSAQDRFRLLEYQELTEARQSSLEANKMATKAIVISIVSFLCSIGFSLYQINNPISLPEKHYSNLSQINSTLLQNMTSSCEGEGKLTEK